MNINIKPGSLTIAGVGIKSISQLTIETVAHVKNADKVLYSVNEPIIENWIISNNQNTLSLDTLLPKSQLRKKIYSDITRTIIEHVESGLNVCVVFYGHPTVFADSALDAVRIIKSNGQSTYVIPGISAQDCLFADLLIDPGSNGCLMYEATDFLIRERRIDKSVHLILWQVGLIGYLGEINNINTTNGTKVLKEYLLKVYAADQEVVVYEAALYPHLSPRIERFHLSDILEVKFTSLTTLYIAPSKKMSLSSNMIDALHINVDDLGDNCDY